MTVNFTTNVDTPWIELAAEKRTQLPPCGPSDVAITQLAPTRRKLAVEKLARFLRQEHTGVENPLSSADNDSVFFESIAGRAAIMQDDKRVTLPILPIYG